MNRKLVCLTIIGIGACAADMMMDEPSDAAQGMREALQVDFTPRTLHWLTSLLLLVILPSYTSMYALVGNYKMSLLLQTISGGYSIFEMIFLRFNNPEGHENITSRTIGWVLSILYGVTVFNGGASFLTLRVYEKIRHSNTWHKILMPLSTTSYKVLSILLVIVGFIKVSVNVVAMLGFCHEIHTGQCNAHGIMGMAFIFYGVFMLTMLVLPWLRKNDSNYSQEFYDSAVITAWGIVNTFTEHRPWEPWSHGDYQHTAMGILFWACGLLGMYLSVGKKRNFMPALTLIFTGYAMSEHSQKLITSTKVHSFFGYVLMFGGVIRIMEISFLLSDQASLSDNSINSFQYLPSLALILSGVLFMGATEEQMILVIDMGADYSSYILIIVSAASIIHLWVLSNLRLYLHLKGYNSEGMKLRGYEHVEEGDADQGLEDEEDFELADL